MPAVSTSEDRHDRWWLPSKFVEPSKLYTGQRVRVESGTFRGQCGDIKSNDGSGEGHLPWMVQIDGNDGVTPYDAEELRPVWSFRDDQAGPDGQAPDAA